MTLRESRPTTRLDLSDPGIWHTGVPTEEFSRLRKESPVAWNERHDGHKGFWAVTRYDDIVAVSRDTDTFSSRNGAISLDDFDDEQNDARRTLLEMDPPHHTKMRKITSSGFSPLSVTPLEGAIRARAASLIDNVVGTGSIEAVSQLTKQLPIYTLCMLLGVPEERHLDMIRWSDSLIGSDDPEFADPTFADFPAAKRRLLPFGNPVSLRAFELGRALAADRRKCPREDVVTLLARGAVDGRPLTDEEFCNYFLMLVVAGNETTRHTLSHGLKALADNPAEWDRFRRQGLDSRVAAAEILRWASPVHFVRRITTKNTRLAGAEISAGEKVAMYFVSGNRDDAYFVSPHQFTIDRTPNPHMAFGQGGPHFCLGNFVARMQIRIMLEELAKRVSSFELTGPVDRLRSNHIHGVKALHIAFNPV